MNRHLEAILSHTAEAVLARLPHSRPDDAALAHARVVSHRGERDGRRVRENTFAAFDPAVAAGVAGIEFDIRYTRDDEPVVVHDADLKRVFGFADIVADTPWQTLRRRVPELPHLQSLLERYHARAHLMIEIKTRGTPRAEQRLVDLLGGLTPSRDFHVLALDTQLFEAVSDLPGHARLPVAKFNLSALHDWAINNDCAGLAGPFALLRSRHIDTLQHRGAWVGSGFVRTPAMCLREIARGVNWVFSNNAVRIQQGLDRARERR
ncbi:glycerophosphoryl diester phosphodiesterase [Salinisphaera sp. T5B8]|uniref:glycerophosphodiester phosphodiesterase n=1 Tax=unclassified Salinisphaera TaxID=2649847 RepID=UPI003340057B